MARKNATNSQILSTSKRTMSPELYSLLTKLVNDDRDELAEIVQRVDYLIQYANSCLKQRDFNEANNSLDMIKARVDKLKSEGIDTEFMENLYEGLLKKTRYKKDPTR